MKRTTAVLGLFLVYLSAADAYSYGGRSASVSAAAPIVQAETLPQSTAGLTGIFNSAAKSTNQDIVLNSQTSADNKLKHDGYHGLVNVEYHETSTHTESSSKIESNHRFDLEQSAHGIGISNTEHGLGHIGLADIVSQNKVGYYGGSKLGSFDSTTQGVVKEVNKIETAAASSSTTDVSNQAIGLDETNSGLGLNRAGIEVADAKRIIDETFVTSKQESDLQEANGAIGVNSANDVVSNKDEKSIGGDYEVYIANVAKIGLVDTTKATADTGDTKNQVVDLNEGLTPSNQGEKTKIGLAAASSATGKTTIGLDQAIVSTGETNNDASAAGSKTDGGSNNAKHGGYGDTTHINQGHIKEHVKVELLDSAVADNTGVVKKSLGLDETTSSLGVNQAETSNQNEGLIVTQNSGGSTSTNQGTVKEDSKIVLDDASSATSKTSVGIEQTNIGTGITHKETRAAGSVGDHYDGHNAGHHGVHYGGWSGEGSDGKSHHSDVHGGHGNGIGLEHTSHNSGHVTKHIADTTPHVKQVTHLNEANSGFGTQNSGGSTGIHQGTIEGEATKIGLNEASGATSKTSFGLEQANSGTGTTHKEVPAAGSVGGHYDGHNAGHDGNVKQIHHIAPDVNSAGVQAGATAEGKIGYGIGLEHTSHNSGHVTKPIAHTTQHVKEVIHLNEENSGFGINQVETSNKNDGLTGTQNSGGSTGFHQGTFKEDETKFGLNEGSGATSKTSFGLEQTNVGTGITHKKVPAAGSVGGHYDAHNAGHHGGHSGGWSGEGSNGKSHHSGVHGGHGKVKHVHNTVAAVANAGATAGGKTGYGIGLEHTSHSSGFDHKSNKGHGRLGHHGSYGGGHGHKHHGHDHHSPDFHGHDFPGHDFHGHDFPGHQLPGHDFPGHDFHGHDFPGHHLPGHDFPGHDFPGHHLPGHDFPGHDFPGHDFPGHDYPHHNFPVHDFPGHEFPGHEFHGDNFHNTDFNGGEFHGNDFHGHGGHESHGNFAGYGGHGSFGGHNTHGLIHSKAEAYAST